MRARYYKPSKTYRRTGGWSKYQTAPVLDRTYKGVKFASKLEMTRYQQLELLQKSGQISELSIQPKFELLPAHGQFKRPLYYVADFRYIEKGIDKPVIEEVKGYETKVWLIKKRLFLFKYADQYEFRILKSEDIQ